MTELELCEKLWNSFMLTDNRYFVSDYNGQRIFTFSERNGRWVRFGFDIESGKKIWDDVEDWD